MEAPEETGCPHLQSARFEAGQRSLLLTTPLGSTTPVTPGETGAQRGLVTCPRSHSSAVTKQHLEASVLASPALTHQERVRSRVWDSVPHAPYPSRRFYRPGEPLPAGQSSERPLVG